LPEGTNYSSSFTCFGKPEIVDDYKPVHFLNSFNLIRKMARLAIIAKWIGEQWISGITMN
jgi:hypothetical protein